MTILHKFTCSDTQIQVSGYRSELLQTAVTPTAANFKSAENCRDGAVFSHRRGRFYPRQLLAEATGPDGGGAIAPSRQ